MPAKRSGEPSKEKLLANLQNAIQEYVDGNGGKLWRIGPITIVPHNPTSFDLLIPCVGHQPTRK
jgi:hypothetical protein